MPLSYPVQTKTYILGGKESVTTLTADLDENAQLFATGSASQFVLYVQYTPAENASVLTLQLEFTPEADSSVFYQSATLDITDGSGVITANLSTMEFVGTTADEVYRFRIVIPALDRSAKILASESTSGDFGALKVTLLVSGV